MIKKRCLDKNYNRHQTRDLLLEYNINIMPPHPVSAGIPMIYPWGNAESIMGDWLYELLKNTGYSGTREEFYNYFGFYLEHKNQEIIFDLFENFPISGDTDKLYFDLNEKILYYWNNEYLPANAMLIARTILNGGEA